MDDFDDDEDDNTDPWNMDKNKNKQPAAVDTKTAIVPPVALNNVEKAKANPFDQNVKPAFDDLEDIGFDLDSDRPIEFNNK